MLIRPCQPDPKDTRDAGFSLLELMVVVVILSILALVIVPRVIDRPDQARAARAQSDIAAISSAVQLYKLDNMTFPSTEQGLAALVTKPASRVSFGSGWQGRINIIPSFVLDI